MAGGVARNKPRVSATHSSHSHSPSWSKRLTSVRSKFPYTFLILICIVVAFGIVRYQHTFMSNPSHANKAQDDAELAQKVSKRQAQQHAGKKKAPVAGFTGIPTADEYRLQAEANEWFPTDPLEKLDDTLRKLPLVFDLGSPQEIEEKSDGYIRMVLDEIKFLLKVLAKSSPAKNEGNEDKKPSSLFDLTNTLHLTLDVMNQCFYRVMKHRILLNNPRLVTKDLVERLTRHWLNEPIKEIILLKNANLSHIVIDTNRVQERKGYDSLVRATQFRLYSLFSYFIASGSKSISLAVHHAVINGDDLAVALLLKLNSDAERGALKLLPTVDRNDIVLRSEQFLEHYQSANELKFEHIAQRIAVALVQHVHFILRKHSLTNFSPTKLSPAVVALVHHYITEHFQGSVPLSPSESADIIEENLELYYQYLYEIQNSDIPDLETLLQQIPLHNEYLPKRFGKLECAANDSMTNTENTCSNEAISGHAVHSVYTGAGSIPEVASPHQCDVDVVQIDSLSPQEFYRKYVMLNKPVLLQLPSSIQGQDDVKQAWSAKGLKDKFGSTKVWLSSIPYGSLFGQEEVVWKFAQYVDYVQLFSRKVLSAASQQFGNNNAASSADSVDLNLTEYYKQHTATVSDIVPESEAGSEKQLQTLASQQVKPWYLFGNDHLEITRALKPMMSQYLQQTFALQLDGSNRNNSTTTSISTTLWDYIFQVSNYNKANNVPNFLALPSRLAKYQFFYGPLLSGAPMHSHGPAFNILLQGEKLWSLLPPARDMYTNLHPLEWFATSFDQNSTEYPFRKADGQPEPLCELRQRAGQVLYVPRHYSHQVLNIAPETLGFAVEVDDYIF